MEHTTFKESIRYVDMDNGIVVGFCKASAFKQDAWKKQMGIDWV